MGEFLFWEMDTAYPKGIRLCPPRQVPHDAKAIADPMIRTPRIIPLVSRSRIRESGLQYLVQDRTLCPVRCRRAAIDGCH
jgi:hypothetical protein